MPPVDDASCHVRAFTEWPLQMFLGLGFQTPTLDFMFVYQQC